MYPNKKLEHIKKIEKCSEIHYKKTFLKWKGYKSHEENILAITFILLTGKKSTPRWILQVFWISRIKEIILLLSGKKKIFPTKEQNSGLPYMVFITAQPPQLVCMEEF